MRLEQFEYVSAAARIGSLRQAAEALHVSQAAMSEAIAKLERELGVPLLERARTGVRVSREGKDLLPQIMTILEAVEGLRALAAEEDRTIRAVRLGSVNTGEAAVVLPALRSLESDDLGVAVDLQHLRQPAIEEGLLAGTLDLGLVNLLEEEQVHPDLVRVRLLSGRPVVIVPAGHPLSASDAVTAADLRAQRFIGAREGYLMNRVTTRLFGGTPPSSWHAIDRADTAKQMVAAGLGVALLPDFTVLDDPAAIEGRMVVRPIAGPSLTIWMTLLVRQSARPFDGQLRLVAALQSQAERAGASAVSRTA